MQGPDLIHFKVAEKNKFITPARDRGLNQNWCSSITSWGGTTEEESRFGIHIFKFLINRYFDDSVLVSDKLAPDSIPLS